MKLTAIISLKDNYSAVMRQAARQTRSFQNDVAKTKSALDAAYRREYNLRIGNSAANKAINQTIKAMKPLRDKAVLITANVQQYMERTEKVRRAAFNLARTPFYVTVKLRDGVSSGLSSLRSTLSAPLKIGAGVTAAAATGAAALGAASLKGAADLERQQISMEHFIGINNKGMTAAQVKAESDKYLNDLRKNADTTPFETGEVITAGTRAIGIAAGNTKMAMNLVRLSEDMAALTPGKKLEDAIEALADLKTGETERMKEFGFKISQDDIKAAAGKMENIKNAEGIALGQMFRGGSEKLSQSVAGMWSTITGTMKTGITNMGVRSLEFLKPQLQRWSNALSGGGADKLFEAGSRMMARLLESFVNGINKAKNFISDRFLNNPEFQKLPDTQSKVKFVFTELKKEWDGWYEKEGKAALSSIASQIGDYLGASISAASGPIAEASLNIGSKIGAGIIKGFDDKISKHPILSAFLSAGAGALAGAVVAGPLGAAVMGGAGLVAPGFMKAHREAMDKVEQIKQQSTLKRSYQSPMFDAEKNNPLQRVNPFVNAPKKAIGMRTVPYDNYPALLHQGERVLTAREVRNEDKAKAPLVFHLSFNKADEPEANKILALLKSALEPVGYNMAPGGAE